ncbi:hypothetical protein QYF36_002477 [Acer negundo]|nr:hypothetical protein QYF36_002477 [Acer negundo]
MAPSEVDDRLKERFQKQLDGNSYSRDRSQEGKGVYIQEDAIDENRGPQSSQLEMFNNTRSISHKKVQVPPLKTMILSIGPGSIDSPSKGPKMDLIAKDKVDKAHLEPCLTDIELTAIGPNSCLSLVYSYTSNVLAEDLPIEYSSQVETQKSPSNSIIRQWKRLAREGRVNQIEGSSLGQSHNPLMAWNENGPSHSASDFICKLDKCTASLKSWSLLRFKNISNQITVNNREIEHLYKSCEQAGVMSAIKLLENSVEGLLGCEEIFWKQRSRAKWLNAGDRNTKFFHVRASARKNKNSIHMLQDKEGSI